MRKFVTAIGVLTVAHAAMAEVQIQVSGPGGSYTTPVEDSPGSKRWSFAVRKEAVAGNANPTTFTVTTTDAQDVLKLVTIESRAPNEALVLELGTSTLNTVGSIGEVRIGSDDADDDGFANVQVFSLGSVDFIQGTRLLNSSILGNLGGVEMQSRGQFSSGNVDNLFIGGSLLGTVEAKSGASSGGVIESITANAAIGKSDLSIGIYALQRIGRVVAGEIINTEIAGSPAPTPNPSQLGFALQIGRVEAGVSVSGSGNFVGEIRTLRFGDGLTPNPGMFCSGTMDGFVAVGEDFSLQSNPLFSPEMKFVGGVKGIVSIGTKTDNINAGLPVTWTAPVKIGPDGPTQQAIVLATEYDSVQIGGGVVGRNPFRGLPLSSFPNSLGPTPPTLDPWSGGFVWKFNGRIALRTTSVPPVRVFRNFTQIWTPCMSLSFTDANTVLRGNVEYLPPGAYIITSEYFEDFDPTGTGGIEPGTESFAVMWSAPFGIPQTESQQFGSAFTVVDPCPGDFNNDGLRNTADLTSLLSKFGSSQPCGAPEDMNVSFAVDTPDLTAFLGVFGQACTGSRPGAPGSPAAPGTPSLAESTDDTVGPVPTQGATTSRLGVSTTAATGSTTESGRPGVPAPMPPVLAALGFTTIESYTAYVDGLTEEQLNAHILQLLQTIEALELP